VDLLRLHELARALERIAVLQVRQRPARPQLGAQAGVAHGVVYPLQLQQAARAMVKNLRLHDVQISVRPAALSSAGTGERTLTCVSLSGPLACSSQRLIAAVKSCTARAWSPRPAASSPARMRGLPHAYDEGCRLGHEKRVDGQIGLAPGDWPIDGA